MNHPVSPPKAKLGGDRLLSISDVADITGLCQTVASQLMDDTGKAIEVRRHKFIFESAFIDYLHSLEVDHDA